MSAFVGVAENQVVPDAGSDEHLAYPGQTAQRFQQSDLATVIHGQVPAKLGIDTTLIPTCPADPLAVTFETVHVGGGAPHIGDDPLEIGMRRESRCFA